MKVLLILCFAYLHTTLASATNYETIPAPLQSLLSFHPAWITRSITSHDPRGTNADGTGKGIKPEGDYQVLFHGKGEGRILRLWMTLDVKDVKKDWQEIWVQIDGQTAYRGSALDFFQGKAAWHAPLVLDFQQSSGAYLSYVPFAYLNEAKILLKGKPHYYQVTYREGTGASAGPSAEELSQFLTENWWTKAAAIQQYSLSAEQPLVLAKGPATISRLSLNVPETALKYLKIRLGQSAPIPLPFFFGLAATGDEEENNGWADVQSAIHFVDAKNHQLATRLPIPLAENEMITLESTDHDPISITYGAAFAQQSYPGVSLAAQFIDQEAPGKETTMAFFETKLATQFVSLVDEIFGGPPRSQRFLEGDEMIRTDQMTYPLQLGTGTEDYFNGGWYFLGVHSNPLSGHTRFFESKDDASKLIYEYSMYRNHIFDPVVSRSGFRFGFEAGDTGDFSPARYQTLGLAYTFKNYSLVAAGPVIHLRKQKDGAVVKSAWDAERDQPAQKYFVQYSRAKSKLAVACPSSHVSKGMLLVRTYDASIGDQEAAVLLNGRVVGRFFEAYANKFRKFAQDALWIQLKPEDCANGSLHFVFDAAGSLVPFSEIEYVAQFYTYEN